MWITHHAHASGGWCLVLSQAPRQRVGGECRRRLMRMLPCAMDSSEDSSTSTSSCRPPKKIVLWRYNSGGSGLWLLLLLLLLLWLLMLLSWLQARLPKRRLGGGGLAGLTCDI